MPSKIRILGPNCARCQLLEKNTQQAVSDLGIDIEIERIDNVDEIVAMGAVSIPVLMINDRVVCAGQIAEVKEIKEWIKGSE
jgi:small redox-active disulfide protein 2